MRNVSLLLIFVVAVAHVVRAEDSDCSVFVTITAPDPTNQERECIATHSDINTWSRDLSWPEVRDSLNEGLMVCEDPSRILYVAASVGRNNSTLCKELTAWVRGAQLAESSIDSDRARARLAYVCGEFTEYERWSHRVLKARSEATFGADSRRLEGLIADLEFLDLFDFGGDGELMAIDALRSALNLLCEDAVALSLASSKVEVTSTGPVIPAADLLSYWNRLPVENEDPDTKRCLMKVVTTLRGNTIRLPKSHRDPFECALKKFAARIEGD